VLERTRQPLARVRKAALLDVVAGAIQIGVKHLSVYAFSTENWKRSPDEVRSGLLERWAVMNDSIERGMHHEGVLPGGLNVRRRAKGLRASLLERRALNEKSPSESIDWASVYAIAVNEENATGGRVVTAPTNGAAGVIPAVIRYYREFYPESNEDDIVTFLLTAAAIGGLCKRNASLSGAEVGCQGEVGVACSMAAGALAEVMGGTAAQVEKAKAVVAAFAAQPGAGAVGIDGKMYDRPHLARAQKLLASLR